jgi:DNA-binding Lrp family transcriptional regulator
MKKKQIDATDIEILNILSEHAEVTNKQLSATIGLSEGPTLVRVQNLWERGAIKSYKALVNYSMFGYGNFYQVRIEIADADSPELKERLLVSRFIIALIEIEATIDIVMRIYIAIFMIKDVKISKEEIRNLTSGLKSIRSTTLNRINYFSAKAFHLDEKDILK